MSTMQQLKEKKPNSEGLMAFDNFLLSHESSQQAFLKLSKNTDDVSKQALLYETKKLLQEHIMKQIKANQVSLKKTKKRKLR